MKWLFNRVLVLEWLEKNKNFRMVLEYSIGFRLFR